MTDDLDGFLQAEYRSRKDHLEDIRQLTSDAANVFLWTFTSDVWPYELKTGDKPRPGKTYSFSTTAMIAFALRLAIGGIDRSSLAPQLSHIAPLPPGKRDEFNLRIIRAMDHLIDKSKGLNKKLAQRKREGFADPLALPPLTDSSTFGWDDPFTLTWLLELLWAEESTKRAEYRAKLQERAWAVVNAVLTDPSQSILRTKPEEVVAHAFPLLRVLHLGETLSWRENEMELSRSKDLSKVRTHFIERVHRHLSESRITDSGFDAADLVFSLEGWILASPHEPDIAVVNEVFKVLSTRQEHTPYWRPLRPFKATSQGLVLLPQSIEIANSLLRICNSWKLRRHNYFARYIGLLDTYARWLSGRAFRGFAQTKEGEEPFVGWESEHTYTLDRIHLWQTSQALIFLQHYAGMLQQYVAETLLQRSGLEVKDFKDGDGVRTWSELKVNEPVGSLSAESAYRVFERISANFIEPRLARGKQLFSMLLYGPPGTGKTSIAESLAKTLGYPLISVTPSDFIAFGGEAVEARAKAIFQVLEEQTKVVVLLDEIDHLLLDRDSSWYKQQGDLFKLLTPGMLTKINRLAKGRSVLFVVATNYYERIDPAIRRPGRIDAQYLVLPPDRLRRSRKLEEISKWAGIPEKLRNEITAATVLFTYKELEQLVEHVQASHATTEKDGLGNAILSRARGQQPIIALSEYDARFSAGDDSADDSPWEEFALLTYLALDATRKHVPEHPDRLKEALARGRVLDEEVAKVLREALAKLDGQQEES